MVPLIAGPEQIDPEWLTAALHHAGSVPPGATVSTVDHHDLGHGKVAHCARLQLRWADPVPAGVPHRLVAKFPGRGDRAWRASRAGHVYLREVLFYRHLAVRAGVRVPTCYLAAAGAGGDRFVLLLGDASPCVSPDQISGAGVADVAVAAGELARLHAAFWGGRGLAGHRWLPDRAGAEGRRLGAAYRLLLPGFLECFGDQLSDVAHRALDRLAGSVRRWLCGAEPPPTLLHGDYRADNLLFGTEPGRCRLTVVDWQTVCAGPGPSDLAYLVGGSLRTADRRAHEDDLFERYFESLRVAGVDTSRADCFRSYRRNAVAGLHMAVVGAMLVEPDDRSDRMFPLLVERHARHAADLDAFAAIDAAG